MLKLSKSIGFDRDLGALDLALQKAAEGGFEGVTIEIVTGGPTDLDAVESDYRGWAAAVRGAGLRSAAVFLRTSFDVHLGTAESALRKRAIDACLQVLERTTWLESDTLILVPSRVGLMRGGGPFVAYEDAYARSLDALSELRFAAQARAVRIACVMPTERFLVSPLEARSFLDAVNSPWVGACVDLAAAAQVGYVQDWLATLGARVMHLRSSSLGRHEQDKAWPAERDILMRMKHTGYVTQSKDSPDA